jgi:hypothetical protein
LSPAAEGLFYFLPDNCSMMESTIAKALNTNPRVISVAKQELEAAGLVRIIHEENKPGRPNPKHRILKVIPGGMHPIPPDYGWVVGAREKVLSPLPVGEEYHLLPIREDRTVMMNWELLKQYSPTEINRMGKLERVEFYMEVGFLVLPTHYPQFSPAGIVTCSCKKKDCDCPGKHPAVRSYKTLTPSSYSKRRQWYLQRFKDEPDLNIGFKVFGFSVLDVDFNHGGDCSLGILREENPGLDETLTVSSPNGEHLYSSTSGLRQSAGLVAAGLDIRSDATSGFIVAPCSIHKSGELYQWQVINDPQQIPQEWLVECEPTRKAVVESAGKFSNVAHLPDQVYPGYLIPESERNNTLFRWACRERGRGAGESHIYKLLLTLRDNHCEKSKNTQDDVSDAELRSIARKACRYLTNAEKLRLSKAA